MSRYARPAACVILGLPREQERARQAVERMVGVAEAVPLTPVVVVADPAVPLPGTARRVERKPKGDAMGELRLGLAQLASSSVEAVVVWPAAWHGARLETLLALLDEFRREAHGIIIPALDGRQGFPLVVARSLWGDVAASDAASLHAAARAAGTPHELIVPDLAAIEPAGD